MRLRLLCSAACILLFPAQALWAQAESQVAAHVARLEQAAGLPDQKSFADILFNPASDLELRTNLDWLGARFQRGDSAFIAYAYSRTLVGAASRVPADQANELKGTALAALLYASSASMVEGLQCADGTARSNRMEQFASQLSVSGLRQLDEPTRRKAAFIAVRIEQNTWPARRNRNDARFQCANGMAAMSAGLAAGQTKERARKPGEIGRQISVTVPPDFVYERRADEDWWADAENARTQLTAFVAKLAEIDRIPSEADMDSLMMEN